jgi:hypothetical protein
LTLIFCFGQNIGLIERGLLCGKALGCWLLAARCFPIFYYFNKSKNFVPNLLVFAVNLKCFFVNFYLNHAFKEKI